jgi:hypothetical protein
VAAGNGTGIEANGMGATLWIGQSAVTENAHGWEALSGGFVQSAGTNLGIGNTGNQGQPAAVAGGFN